MRPSALVERYRMALEVIAAGPEWEPGTMVAKIALTDPWVSQEAIAPEAEMDEHAAAWAKVQVARQSINEAVELAREQEPYTPPEVQDALAEPEPEPEPVEPEKVVEPEPDMPGTDGLSPLAVRVLQFVRSNGQVSSVAIRTYLGSDVSDARRKKACADLIERGVIVGEGVSIDRRYVPVEASEAPAVEAGQDKPTMPDREPASEKVAGAGGEDGYTLAGMPAETAEVKRNGHGSDEGRVLDSVGFKPGWSIAQHASRLGLHIDKVSVAIRKLERESEVKAEAKNGRVVWSQI